MNAAKTAKPSYALGFTKKEIEGKARCIKSLIINTGKVKKIKEVKIKSIIINKK